MHSHHRYLKGLCLALISFFLVSCGAGMVAPTKGVTDRFFRQAEDRTVNLATYDFERLKQGYGLCMFSYEFTGQKGSRISGRSEETKRGLRVWEHKFSDADLNTTRFDKSIMVWGYRSLTTLMLTKSGYAVKVSVPFHEGQIVYGGRLIVNFPEINMVESHYDEDVAPWLEEFGDKIPLGVIESELMSEGQY
jgi:hypothetical protein